MTKQEIIQKVNDTNASPLVKEMVLGYVDLAFDSGFQEGMQWGVKTVVSINKALLNDHADNVREAGQGK